MKRIRNEYNSSGEDCVNAEAQFKNEIMNLVRVKHPNIIQLVGYCYEVQKIVTKYEGKFLFAEMEEKVLCLEYMQGGTLKNHLSGIYGGILLF